ncbi:hypothetical protein CDAR_304121 [Caerostris darwini]|uniref:Uncharacterized protein n=1 Tax=Caerostris darwini TaxID=1538125 RepID=A0AAV4WAK8_9ARAC|nr:hypothetical protein CDAR_304121 [Caerostris darwini]
MHDAWGALCRSSVMSSGQGPPLEPRQGAPKPRPDPRPRELFSSDGFPDNSRRQSKDPGQPKARSEICEDLPTVRVAPNMESGGYRKKKKNLVTTIAFNEKFILEVPRT